MTMTSKQKWIALKSRVVRMVTKPSDVPVNPRHDDLYLVEFPKSGMTWLCFLMANVNLLLSGDEKRQVTFFNIHSFIPEINVSPYIADPLTLMPGFRIIKSHAQFNINYKKIFYLVRDPRHVMVSYHAFMTQLGWYQGTLEQLVDDERLGISAWCEHVAGWLDRVPASHRFAWIRYEELLDDTRGELKGLYRLLGFELDEELLTKAVERSSAERMRTDEAFANARHPANVGLEFIRKGKMGGARAPLAAEIKAKIERAAGPLMRRLGYEVSG